jgi:hypothetical protein
MTNIMDNERVRHILDLLEKKFETVSPYEFDCTLDEIEEIL